MKIYAIIVTYNGMKWMDKCLSCLADSSVKLIPIISDNGSTDGTVDFVRNKAPEAIIFENGRNLGFGQANNVGLKYAMENGADYMLLVNQDVYIEKDTVATLLSHSDGHSIMSPFHYNGDGSALDENFKNGVLYSEGNNYSYLPQGAPFRQFYSVSVVNAAFWLIPREIIFFVGGFNPLFFHYNEDLNYADRIRGHYYKFLVCSDAKMYHDRNGFGNSDLYQKDFVFRYLLWYFCDPTRNLIKRWRRSLYLSKQKGYCSAMFRILKLSSKISKSRKKEKLLGSTWLGIVPR